MARRMGSDSDGQAATIRASSSRLLQALLQAEISPFATPLSASLAIGCSCVRNADVEASTPFGHLELNHGPIAKYFEHSARENTARPRTILLKADRINDALGLDDELLVARLTSSVRLIAKQIARGAAIHRRPHSGGFSVTRG
jgi:hypothetical protein